MFGLVATFLLREDKLGGLILHFYDLKFFFLWLGFDLVLISSCFDPILYYLDFDSVLYPKIIIFFNIDLNAFCCGHLHVKISLDTYKYKTHINMSKYIIFISNTFVLIYDSSFKYIRWINFVSNVLILSKHNY